MDGRTISATLSGGVVTSIDGAEAHPVDAFKGSREFSATAPEYFVFDGAGSWSRYYDGREQAAIRWKVPDTSLIAQTPCGDASSFCFNA